VQQTRRAKSSDGVCRVEKYEQMVMSRKHGAESADSASQSLKKLKQCSTFTNCYHWLFRSASRDDTAPGGSACRSFFHGAHRASDATRVGSFSAAPELRGGSLFLDAPCSQLPSRTDGSQMKATVWGAFHVICSIAANFLVFGALFGSVC
jgi:hypothetical protein